MPNDEFSDFDDLPKDLVEEFKKLNAGVLISESSLGGEIAIVPNEKMISAFHYAICYLPEEMNFLLSFSDEKAKSVHSMKRRFDGTLRVEGRKLDVARQIGAAV